VTWCLNGYGRNYQTKVRTLSLLLLERIFLEQFQKHPYMKYLLYVKKDICHSNIVSDVIKNKLSVFVECMDDVLEYACQRSNFVLFVY
jgi:hypothetical protein